MICLRNIRDRYIEAYILVRLISLPGVNRTFTIPIDFNNDFIINLGDVNILVSDYGQVSPYDLNNDYIVNIRDLVIIAGFFGESYSSSSHVILSKTEPEPGEQIQITVESDNQLAEQAAFYLISTEDSTDYSKVCGWPGSWQTIGTTPIGSPLTWASPTGNYYVVANLLDSSGSVVCTGAFAWDAKQG